MADSRLSRQSTKKTARKLFLSILGIALVIAAVFKFGIPLLVNFSLLIAGSKVTSGQQQNTQNFIAPPALNPTYTATNSASVTITGFGSDKQTIALYVNGELIDKKETEKDGTFTFEDVEIPKDENTIKTRAIQEGKESDFSNELVIRYKKDPPTLSIDEPSENQQFTKDDDTARVFGIAQEAQIVTVNGFRAIVESNGSYSYTLRLQHGENTIKVEAIDEAGNKKEMERKVTYTP